MKHILLIFHHYRTPKDLGGLRSWHIGSYLAKQGYRVTAIIPGIDTLTGKKHSGLRNKLWFHENVDGVNVIRTNATKNDRTSKIKRILYYFTSSVLQFFASMTVRKVDAVICTSMPLSSMFFSLLQASIRGGPLIIDVRDLVLDAAIELGYIRKNIIAKIVHELEACIFRHADALISVSEGFGEILSEKGVDRSKIHVVPIGYDGKKAYQGYVDWGRDMKEELGLKDKFVVLYAGTLGHIIDIPTVLKAAQETAGRTDIVYLFVGGGQKLQEYRDFSEEQGLSCLFVGQRPKSDIPLLCSQADVCVYPIREGRVNGSMMGNKIFDYMGNGAFTLYTGPDGDVERLINRAGSGKCFACGDSRGLADCILDLVQNPQKLSGSKARALQYAEKELMISKMMGKFEFVVSQLVR